jgi:alkylation response protein AidB-like acyl-CoA dehydrogenase
MIGAGRRSQIDREIERANQWLYGVAVSDEPIGPDSRCSGSARLGRALQIISELAPDAQRLESEGVTVEDVRRLAEAHVLSAGVDDRWSAPEVREIHEQLAAASGALWFVMTQHRSPSVAAATTDNTALRTQYADGLASGQILGAVSFAHLRRARPTVVAERTDVGWQISGRLDWITSWGLADVLLLMAETTDGLVVQTLIPARERDGLTVTGALSLAAMQGTSTVGAVLERMCVSDAEVAHLVPKEDWLEHDAQRTANVPAAVVGLARAAVNSLLLDARQRRWAEAAELAEVWRNQLVQQRNRAYQLIDDVDPSKELPERRALRGSITKLAQDATAMLVTVQAGRSMLTSSSAQRWAREALFSLVQAQTPATRNALIGAYRVSTRPAAP